MAIQRVSFFQRNTSGAPLAGATITTTSLYDDASAGPVIGNAVELDAGGQPGFYYFDVDVATSKVLTVVTDAGAGVTDANNRYQSFVLNDTPLNIYTIANRVWDDTTAGHVGAGTFGLALGTTLQTSIAAIPDATDISDAVWDAPQINHQDSGTFGLLLNGLAQATSSEVWGADATLYGGGAGTIMGDLMVSTPGDTWDVVLASHSTVGSTGAALAAAAAGGTPAAIATAVWGALVASNQTVGSFGEAVTILQALAHRNWRLTGATYSGSPARLTAATLVCYPTKADALANTNAILTQAFTATYNANGEMTASIQTDL